MNFLTDFHLLADAADATRTTIINATAHHSAFGHIKRCFDFVSDFSAHRCQHIVSQSDSPGLSRQRIESERRTANNAHGEDNNTPRQPKCEPHFEGAGNGCDAHASQQRLGNNDNRLGMKANPLNITKMIP
jgi:hypothetical protein